eukprot:SM000006S19487  [mRNA]  locus=s6:1055535:1056492:- [translate_table: standard]
MAWLASGRSNGELVQQLARLGVLSSRRAAAVMAAVDRGLFVPPSCPAYADSPQPIGFNATISAPHMHALCLELLEDHLARPGARALDVGAGSGYLAACFATMVGDAGKTIGVEHIPELVESARASVGRSAAAPLLEKGALELHCADGREGWAACAPYDAIHVGAAAESIPPALVDQLAVGGRLVVPVGTASQELRVIDKLPDGSLRNSVAAGVRYVPLTSRSAQLTGEVF